MVLFSYVLTSVITTLSLLFTYWSLDVPSSLLKIVLEIFSLKIIDINGKVVANKSNINSKTQIDTHTFSNGFYTIEITTNDGILFTQKINITQKQILLKFQ